MNSVFHKALVLGACTLVCSALIALTHHFTKDQIAAQQQAKAQSLLLEVTGLENVAISGCEVFDADLAKPLERYALIDTQAYVLKALTNKGYNGGISLLIGVSEANTISGVRVLKHSETPGLGDKIELAKDDWILAFNGLSTASADTFAIKKDGGRFDQFAGATITPRAVVNAVKSALSNATPSDARCSVEDFGR